MFKPEQPDYSAGFKFTNNSQWLVRMQETGAGYADLYLYRLGPQGFVAATTKPLSDLAWRYFKSLCRLPKGQAAGFRCCGGPRARERGQLSCRSVRIGRTADTSSSPCLATFRPIAGTVKFARFGAGAGTTTCKKAGSTCRRTLPRRTQNRSLPVRIRRSRAAAPARLVHDPEKWKPVFG